MSEFRVRIRVQVCGQFHPREWRDDWIRISVDADHQDEAVRLVEKAISRLVEHNSQRRISIVAEEEKS
jgi:hypothetical protein